MSTSVIRPETTKAAKASTASSGRNQSIDSLRALAAGGVFCAHVVRIPPTPIVELGRFGVLLFFLVSGYCITLSLARREPRPLAAFLIRRGLRLFPAYWVGVVLAIVCATTAIPATVMVANFTMLQEFLEIPHVNGVYWTLSVELLFYIGVGAFAAAKRQHSIFLNRWALGVVLVAVVLNSVVRRLTGWPLPYAHAIFFSMFLLGSLIAREGANCSWREIWGWSVATLSGAGIATWAIFVDGPSSLYPPWQHWGNIALAVLLFSFVVQHNALQNALLGWFGALSYCVYLFQDPIHMWAEKTGLKGAVGIVIVAGLTVSLSALVHYAIERPVQHFSKAICRRLGAAIPVRVETTQSVG